MKKMCNLVSKQATNGWPNLLFGYSSDSYVGTSLGITLGGSDSSLEFLRHTVGAQSVPSGSSRSRLSSFWSASPTP